jgi:hypothetical protein
MSRHPLYRHGSGRIALSDLGIGVDGVSEHLR